MLRIAPAAGSLLAGEERRWRIPTVICSRVIKEEKKKSGVGSNRFISTKLQTNKTSDFKALALCIFTGFVDMSETRDLGGANTFEYNMKLEGGNEHIDTIVDCRLCQKEWIV